MVAAKAGLNISAARMPGRTEKQNGCGKKGEREEVEEEATERVEGESDAEAEAEAEADAGGERVRRIIIMGEEKI